MTIREYRPEDCAEILRLFYDTVHSVCAADYSPMQLDAWATGEENPEVWNSSLMAHRSVVAVEDGRIVGFGDAEGDYLDRLYVHRDYQRRGIAAAICDTLEGDRTYMTVHASLTARPFFERRGYRVVKEQQVVRHGVMLTNFLMGKRG